MIVHDGNRFLHDFDTAEVLSEPKAVSRQRLRYSLGFFCEVRHDFDACIKLVVDL